MKRKDVEHLHRIHLLVNNKYDSNGRFIKVKSRGVLDGRREREGFDCMAWKTRTTMISRRGMIILHCCALYRGHIPIKRDVEEAFLRTQLDPNSNIMFVEVAPAFIGLENDEIMAAQAKLYGAHEAPANFQKDFSSVLEGIGMFSVDHSEVELRKHADGTLCGYHVDDGEWVLPDGEYDNLITALNKKFLTIEKRFPLKDGTPARRFRVLDSDVKYSGLPLPSTFD